MTTVFVTGSTDGIGLRTAQTLRARGCDVIVHGRDPRKVAAARDGVGAVAGLVADLGDLHEVTRLADEASELRPEVLINNAGIYARERTQAPSGPACSPRRSSRP
jgi:NAD(P)-dependent dehydrogenase (short-subunit alcohol dehydrogenase family)